MEKLTALLSVPAILSMLYVLIAIFWSLIYHARNAESLIASIIAWFIVVVLPYIFITIMAIWVAAADFMRPIALIMYIIISIYYGGWVFNPTPH
jgi:hypothetical protein